MTEMILNLEVREVDLVHTMKVLFENQYKYVVVHRNHDGRPIYKIEAHRITGETE